MKYGFLADGHRGKPAQVELSVGQRQCQTASQPCDFPRLNLERVKIIGLSEAGWLGLAQLLAVFQRAKEYLSLA